MAPISPCEKEPFLFSLRAIAFVSDFLYRIFHRRIFTENCDQAHMQGFFCFKDERPFAKRWRTGITL